jgi:hypothetical protein
MENGVSPIWQVRVRSANIVMSHPIIPLFTVYCVLWRTIELKETEPKERLGP